MGVTRSEAKSLLKSGKITLNGAVCKDGSLKADTDKDKVCLEGKDLSNKEHTYVVLNKPAGFVTTASEKEGRNVMELVKDVTARNLFPVGRLDKDTEGLLLFTDDGELSHRLLSPKHHVPKTYHVECAKEITEADIEALEKGVDIGDEDMTLPAGAVKTGDKSLSLTITEGRFHQVKRMLKAVGNEVVFLKRLAFGGITLDELNIKTGEYVVLNNELENRLKDYEDIT